jgi:hypothetical protein
MMVQAADVCRGGIFLRSEFPWAAFQEMHFRLSKHIGTAFTVLVQIVRN